MKIPYSLVSWSDPQLIIREEKAYVVRQEDRIPSSLAWRLSPDGKE